MHVDQQLQVGLWLRLGLGRGTSARCFKILLCYFYSQITIAEVEIRIKYQIDFSLSQYQIQPFRNICLHLLISFVFIDQFYAIFSCDSSSISCNVGLSVCLSVGLSVCLLKNFDLNYISIINTLSSLMVQSWVGLVHFQVSLQSDAQ